MRMRKGKNTTESTIRRLATKKSYLLKTVPLLITSERIYDIRCKVVHTKSLEDGGGEDMILPFSKEADLLIDDVELIQFLARRVLIASSAPLKIS
jgi:hypothetical protein